MNIWLQDRSSSPDIDIQVIRHRRASEIYRLRFISKQYDQITLLHIRSFRHEMNQSIDEKYHNCKKEIQFIE